MQCSIKKRCLGNFNNTRGRARKQKKRRLLIHPLKLIFDNVLNSKTYADMAGNDLVKSDVCPTQQGRERSCQIRCMPNTTRQGMILSNQMYVQQSKAGNDLVKSGVCPTQQGRE